MPFLAHFHLDFEQIKSFGENQYITLIYYTVLPYGKQSDEICIKYQYVPTVWLEIISKWSAHSISLIKVLTINGK